MDFAVLAQTCAPSVAPQALAAIVKTESAFRPLVIGVNGGAQLMRQPATREEAVATATWLIAKGYNIDLGLGQINSSNLLKTGLSVDDAFEPCKNIAAAALILHGNYQVARRRGQGEQAALQAALSAYNTGSFSRGFSNGYVQKVVAHASTAMAAVPLQAVTPVAPLGAKASKRAVQLRGQPVESVVRLTAERATAPIPPPSVATVFDASTANAIVY